ncbi:MAG: methyltransferase domain-containing protein [Bacteroidales bacterium]|nr:methyltransferase domain-containing protein [Bacteroidales bacterium]
MKRFVFILLIIILATVVSFYFLRNRAKPWSPEWEEKIETFQPTSKIMNVIGVEKGMKVGEIGAGNGRFSVRLAKRVGSEGKVFANDIDLKAVRFMKQRLVNENINNVQVILSRETNPYFPKNTLDMVCVINSYENFSDPVRLLANTYSSLKKDGILAIVAFDPEKSSKKKEDAVSKELLIGEVKDAGYQLLSIDSTSLVYDNVYLFKKEQ